MTWRTNILGVEFCFLINVSFFFGGLRLALELGTGKDLSSGLENVTKLKVQIKLLKLKLKLSKQCLHKKLNVTKLKMELNILRLISCEGTVQKANSTGFTGYCW